MLKYKKDYNETWKDIVEDKNGNLKEDQIKRELSDYGIVISHLTKIYYAVTQGRVSKVMTKPEIVIEIFDELYIDRETHEKEIEQKNLIYFRALELMQEYNGRSITDVMEMARDQLLGQNLIE